MSSYERWTLGVNVATLLGVAVAATIYYCQLSTMQATLGNSYKPIIELTKYPSEPEFIHYSDKGTAVAWTLDYGNEGRGLAIHRWSEFRMSFTDPNEADRVMRPATELWRTPELSMKPTEVKTGQIFYERNLEQIDDRFAQHLDRWKAGHGWLNAQVIFHYMDEAGEWHGSSICWSFQHSTPPAFVTCASKDANSIW